MSERAERANNAVFESVWLGARAANAVTNFVGVPAGMFRLVAGPGMVLFVSGVSNSICTCFSFSGGFALAIALFLLLLFFLLPPDLVPDLECDPFSSCESL